MSGKGRGNARRWVFDGDGTVGAKVDPPVGFISGDFKTGGDSNSVERLTQQDKIKQSANAVARQPVQRIFMSGIMMFMMGNTLQIFSIMMLGMAVVQPLTGIMGTNKTFERFENRGVDLTMAKLTYAGLHVVSFAIVCWKLNKMGLLPSAWELGAQPTLKSPLEFSSGYVTA